MPNRVRIFVSKIFRKLAMAALVSALALVTWSLWLYGRDRVSYDEHRTDLHRQVRHDTEIVESELARLNEKKTAATAELAMQQQRLAQADKVLKNLHDFDPGVLDRLFGDSGKNTDHANQLTRVETIKTSTEKLILELQQEITLATLATPALEERRAVLQEEEATLRAEDQESRHYLRVAWRQSRWVILAVFCLYLFGGALVSAALYYGWARWVARGRPVQLGTESPLLPTIGESLVSVEESVWPGEALWVRKEFLQSTDDGLTRKKRFILNWKAPFSSIAAGLWRLTEFRNSRSNGERRVVFADSNDPFAELVVVGVPDGGSFVVRAGFVKGYIAQAEQQPRILRRWRFFFWQSWVAGQWGYFEFTGPCRLIVSCVSALQGERIGVSDDGQQANRRALQAGLVGFTPRLELKTVRSESFWRYLRGQSPLFDVELTGNGRYLTRNAGVRGRDCLRARFFRWAGI